MHALIIEDEPLIAMQVEDILRDCGFLSFHLAATPQEAFEAVSHMCPDLITSDVNLMPGSGIDTVLAICGATPVPVVFITGNIADVSDRVPDAIALSKPFTDANLRKAVVVAITEPRTTTVLFRDDATFQKPRPSGLATFPTTQSYSNRRA